MFDDLDWRCLDQHLAGDASFDDAGRDSRRAWPRIAARRDGSGVH